MRIECEEPSALPAGAVRKHRARRTARVRVRVRAGRTVMNLITRELDSLQGPPEAAHVVEGVSAVAIALRLREFGRAGQKTQSLRRALDAVRILDCAAEHLQTAANRKRRLVGGYVGGDRGIEAAFPQPGEF